MRCILVSGACPGLGHGGIGGARAHLRQRNNQYAKGNCQ